MILNYLPNEIFELILLKCDLFSLINLNQTNHCFDKYKRNIMIDIFKKRYDDKMIMRLKQMMTNIVTLELDIIKYEKRTTKYYYKYQDYYAYQKYFYSYEYNFDRVQRLKKKHKIAFNKMKLFCDFISKHKCVL